MAEKALTGSSAWGRLFEELTSAIEVELSDARVPLDVALSRLTDPDRELRRTSAEAITAALAPGLRTRAYVYNTLLADKATDDRLRRFPNWLRRGTSPTRPATSPWPRSSTPSGAATSFRNAGTG